MTVVSNSAEDLAASFDIGPVSHSATARTQLMPAAKLHRRIVVHASNSSDPVLAALGSSSNSSADGSALSALVHGNGLNLNTCLAWDAMEASLCRRFNVSKGATAVAAKCCSARRSISADTGAGNLPAPN